MSIVMFIVYIKTDFFIIIIIWKNIGVCMCLTDLCICPWSCQTALKFTSFMLSRIMQHIIIQFSEYPLGKKNLQELLLIKTRWTWCYSAGILILSCLPEFNVWKTNVPLSMLQPKTLWKSVSNLNNYFLVLD